MRQSARLAPLMLLIGAAGLIPADRPALGDDPTPAFLAGAATSNVTPPLGSSINGSMSDVRARHVHDELHARCLVLDDGRTRLAFVVVDSCALDTSVVNQAKALISERNELPPERVLISATHTHSAGTCTGVFQSDPDPDYQRFLAQRIADGVARAINNLEPARIGWGVGELPGQVFNRRWHMKPGTIGPDPFGREDDQVRMNPPPGSPDLDRPAGPTDPGVSLLAVQTLEGRPIAVLANYSLHYVGGVGPGHVSADYFGAFARNLAVRLDADRQARPFVAILSNGTSGDINNINFREPAPARQPYEQIERVADDLAAEVERILQSLRFRDAVTLDARLTTLRLGVRKPDREDLNRARQVLDDAGEGPLTTLDQIYARETVKLADYPDEVPVAVQAFRVGELGIVSIPCEVFVEIGLELKERSPLKPTFTIELANGYNGYLPTPEHHALGGYETWRARSSYLEVDASRRITDAALSLLDELASP